MSEYLAYLEANKRQRGYEDDDDYSDEQAYVTPT